TENVIREIYPDYWEDYHRLVNEKHTYFGNICIMSKKDYDMYCSWLFDIFFHLQPRLNLDDYDAYHKRVYGFISEFLLYVWVTHNKKRAYECKVGMTGEKAETREVKEKLNIFFKDKDIAGAKEFFKEYLDKRPDILMEASDVNGDLRVAMQMISTAEHEIKRYGHSFLDTNNNFYMLLKLFKLLNSIVVRYCNNTQTTEDAGLLKSIKPSKILLEISAAVFSKNEETYNRAVIRMASDITMKDS
ncbi:MAG: DUF4422 domain-containing protein, partial [Eubacteriales bacterium]|nr:DUF4422 domain-containing protein [Eubacteriales bacterium]